MPPARPGRWEVGVLLRDLSARLVVLMALVAGWSQGNWRPWELGRDDGAFGVCGVLRCSASDGYGLVKMSGFAFDNPTSGAPPEQAARVSGESVNLKAANLAQL